MHIDVEIENLAERAQELHLSEGDYDDDVDELKWFHINTMIGNTTKVRRAKKTNANNNDYNDDGLK